MVGRQMELGKGWAVLHVDPQVDFMEGGALAVRGGHDIIPILNRTTDIALRRGASVAMSADWHPKGTAHFKKWPVHCVENTPGADFGPGVETKGVTIFYKGTSKRDDGYSPFEGKSKTGETLDEYLQRNDTKSIVFDGLATDYCVNAGVLDALKRGRLFGRFGRGRYQVYVVEDGIRAVNAKEGDGVKAIKKMKRRGAIFINSANISN